MRSLHRPTLSTFATLFVLGCSSDSLTGTAGTIGSEGGPAAGSSSIQALVDAICSAARTCCGRAGKPAEPLADCESEVIRQVDPLQEVVNRTVVVNAARFSACVAEYQAAASSCEYPATIGKDCKGIFSGTLREGERCTRAEECIGGTDPVSCLLPISDGGAGRTGVCHDLGRGGPGDACIVSGDEHFQGTTFATSDPNPPFVYCHSADGLFCTSMANGTCEPIAKVGSPCMGLECGEDAYCDTTCIAKKPAGSACAHSSECQSVQACNNGICGPLGIAADKLCNGDFD